MKNLVIVESPAKAETIKKILLSSTQDRWVVVASRGYIKELPKEYGLNFNGQEFSADWVYDKGKKEFIKELKKNIHAYDEVYIATDDDIEGEKIAYDLVEELKIQSKYKRVTFASITKDDILSGIDRPRELDVKKYNMACNRRYIDRDEGYGISEVIRFDFARNGISFPSGLGVGRAISPALHLIAENNKLIKDFEPQEYIRVLIRYLKNNMAFEYLHPTRYMVSSRDDQVALNLFMRQISTAKHQVVGYTPKQEEVSPPEPLHTATLQSSAFYVFGFSGKETMKLAQSMYENGVITYHRTDSNFISDKAYHEIIDYLYETESPDNIYDAKRKYKERKNSQASHEAVRAAKISKETEPENIALYAKREYSFEMTKKHLMLYELIWYRTVATQMADAIYDRSLLKLDAGGNIFEIRANTIINKESGEDDGLVRKKMSGWMSKKSDLLEKSVMTEGEEYKYREVKIPRLSVLDEVDVLEIAPPSPTKTRAPHRYGEGRFITTIEKLGIARPSSLDGILPSLESKGLIQKINGIIHIKKMGEVVDEWVTEYCSWLNSIEGVVAFDEAMQKEDEGEEESVAILYKYHEKIEALKKEIGFIEKSDRVYPASEGQILMAKKIAMKKKIILKEEYFNDSALMSKFISENLDADDGKYIGSCPECKKGRIVENSKAFGCNQFANGCGFTIWKNSSKVFLEKYSIFADDEYLREVVKLALNKKPLFSHKVKSEPTDAGSYIDIEKSNKGWGLRVRSESTS